MAQMFGRLKEFWEAPRENKRLRKQLDNANERIARQSRRIKQLQASEDAHGVSAENIVWIFGGARTGSTWLSGIMGELKGYAVWNEPLVGALFGDFYYQRAGRRIGRPGKHHILGRGHRKSWLGSIRAFVLKEASGRFPEAAGPDNYLVVKEPNGSFGAPLLMEALPESRMILLVRDPRDVVASGMDARRQGSWNYEKKKQKMKQREGTGPLPVKDLDTFVRRRARSYLRGMEVTKQAYEAHKGGKVVVKYEELVADNLGTMRRIGSELGLRVDEEELKGAVERHSWENIPEQEKGPGKKRRKGTPGGWRDDLTPEQARIVEEVTRSLLEEFYP